MTNSNRRTLHFNMLTIFTAIVIATGLTACSGKGSNSRGADSNSSKSGTLGNGQDYAIEIQEAQPTDTPTPYVSRFAAEEEQVISGKCGKNAVWTYDTGSRLLQITGTGVVDQIIKKSKEYVSKYGVELEYPVKEIQVGEGITALDGGPLFLNVIKEEETEEIKITLPNSLEKIGVDTFDPGQSDAEYIRHIHLPCKVRYIEGGAFWGIGDGAAPHVYSYKEDVKEISKKYKSKLKITVDSNNPYYTVKSGVLFTKDMKTLVYYPSEKIDKVYRIPKSVTRIKALAFARNSFLKEIVLPRGIQVIGAGAFFSDHRLAKINLEQAKKLKRIRDFDGVKYKIDFLGAGAPEGMEVPEQGEEYCDPAEYQKDFYRDDMSNLKASYFLGTFAGTNLKSIQFPERLKYVAYNTFENCFRLKKIAIGDSYAGEINSDHIGNKKGFLLPDRQAMEIQVSDRNEHYKVKNHILYSKDGKTLYKALKSYKDSTLVLDQGVQKIARQAFFGAVGRSLRKVIVLGNLKQISREAFAISNIKSFEVYGSVDTIGIDAFYMCYNLKKFICHGTVKHVDAQAFYYAANLTEISLGKNIKSIGEDAFEGCDWIQRPRVRKKK